MRLLSTGVFVLLSISSFAQDSFKALVTSKASGSPLPGATAVVKGTTLGATADNEGKIELTNVPEGEQLIEFSFVGYESEIRKVVFPLTSNEAMIIVLAFSDEELAEIVISSTRSSRTIADIPTRVEFIAGEELDEKANMKPGDIRMLLSESTGIQTQQTSATSANASIRIQGLDGRYTQILKDGFPLYAGFSGGLGLLQTAPLDLKQAEVIKGSLSTLYGGGAIAGLVNLISRVPTSEKVMKFLVNGTSAKGLDVSGFFSNKFGKFGMTLFASRNSSEPYDPAGIDLTAIPKFKRYTFNPRFFFDIDAKTNLTIGLNLTTEDRVGGDIHVIEGNASVGHSYFESNKSNRISTQLSISHKLTANSTINFKNSTNHFDRTIQIPDYQFDGSQTGTFTELNFIHSKEISEWIIGINLWTDNFSEKQTTTTPLRDYNQTTFGAFVQNNLKLSPKVNLETGLRTDFVVDYGFAVLPRVSLLYKPGSKFSTRVGGGLGYKTPTIFTEESERIHFQNVLPISTTSNVLEKSYGANLDLNYRTQLDDVGFSINHLFFYTYLNDPLMLRSTTDGNASFVNITGFIDSRGTETNVKVEFGDFKLFLGYTFTDTKIHENGNSVQNPLTAKHRLNNVLMYELEEKWKVGLEAYYFSKQRLSDDTYGKDFWICGFMVEKLWERFSLFINFENFLDARQTRFDTIFMGSITNPVFKEIYAPVDGFVVNGGIKLDL